MVRWIFKNFIFQYKYGDHAKHALRGHKLLIRSKIKNRHLIIVSVYNPLFPSIESNYHSRLNVLLRQQLNSHQID